MEFSEPETTQWFDSEILPHQDDLKAWLRARFPSISDVDDLLQESFRRLIKARASGPIVNPRAFLFVTARNLALNHLRHLRYERPEGSREMDPLSIVDEMRSPLDNLAVKEEVQHLIAAIQSLPRRCRQVMTLRKIYGLSQKEVANRLGISEHTVEAQGSIGLRKCIEYFRRKGYPTRKQT
ncbi:sigma-70 family RNA polymerase sigma factor [Pelagicoccus sp. SDUM812003]|uniref:RNA polymerase sigma factor n=1 Tax=Pelagicoccus sp. SDUM812003 TaxID=3041267 RepID=UPI00280FB1EF|nr:sigma-70 family RNA polymerase sigma factor [Pelagicoccus sp. SDUM812003]MDQ8205522.1 sigma-70 family RNA polymerase sigma factor [Pelagicoccus sp. SDUM812003]